MTGGKIEWTDRSDWNPVRGCIRVSEGCRNCYAEVLAARFSQPGGWGHGYAHMVGGDHRWTGKVELIEDRLTLPLGWEKPAKVFVNSTSDIFHESLPDEVIDRIFAVMALCPHLTFQMLTKRSARMSRYLAEAMPDGKPAVRPRIREAARNMGMSLDHVVEWPLPNVWLGVSVEDQAAANERIPHLLVTPAAVRFLSCEPLLGTVDLEAVECDGWMIKSLSGSIYRPFGATWRDYPSIDWVICGGDSGHGAREMHYANAASLRDQCAAAGVPFFFKQWGSNPVGVCKPPRGSRGGALLDGVAHLEFPKGAVA